MDERIDPKKPGKLKGNVTRFRRDRRLAVVRALHSLALVGMLATVVFGIFHYQDELNADSLRRMISYIKAAGLEPDPFTEYRFEAGLKTVYAPFGSGLAVASGDTYSFISGLGDSSYSVQLSYNSPAICVSDKYVLLYDRGGKGFCVVNSYAEYLNSQLESPILSASMNRRGGFSLITNEAGYRSAVTVYSHRQKLLCRWLTAQYYVLLASVSPEETYFAAVCLGQESLSLRTQVLYFRIGEEEALWTADLGEKQVYSLTHDKSGGLVILCDDGVYRYDPEGRLTRSLSFTLPVRLFSVQEEGALLVSFDHTDRSSRTTDAMVFGDQLSVLWKGTFPGLPRAVDCQGGCAALLMNDRLELIYYDRESPFLLSLDNAAARDVVVDPEGCPILIHFDRAEKVRPERED